MKAASESCLVACWRVIATVVLDVSHFFDLFCDLFNVPSREWRTYCVTMKTASESCLVACWRGVATVVIDLLHFCDVFYFLLREWRKYCVTMTAAPESCLVACWRGLATVRLIRCTFVNFLFCIVEWEKYCVTMKAAPESCLVVCRCIPIVVIDLLLHFCDVYLFITWVWKILCCNWFVALLWFILFFIVWWENTMSRWKQRLSHVSLRADVALQLL